MPSPWLIQWGAEVFLGLLASSTLLGALSWFPLRRLRARRVLGRHPDLRERPVDPGRFADGILVTLRGTLELDGAPCRRFEDGAATAAASIEVPLLPRESVRAPKLAVKVDGIAVEVSGPIDLVLGTAERWRRWPLGKLPRPIAERAVVAGLEVGAFPHRRAIFRSVAAGDAVLAAGKLQACAADRETGEYRKAALRFVLVGEQAGRPVALACAGSPRLTGCWISVVRCAVAGAVLLGSAATLVGEVTWDADDPGWNAVAAATPFRRADAIERLAQRVRGMVEPSPAAIREALGLASVPPYCEPAAQAILQSGDAREAARIGQRCGTDRGWSIAARAGTALGELDRASAAADHAPWALDPRTRVRMHLLAGDFGRASATAAEFPRALPDCLPDALAVRAGDPDALGRLARSNGPDEPGSAVCALLYADLLPPAERLPFLEARTPMNARGGRRHPALTERIASLLQREADPAREEPAYADEWAEPNRASIFGLQPGDRVLLETNPERLPLELETELRGVPALERSVLGRLAGLDPGDRTLAERARLSASQAAFESIAGRDGDARTFVEGAVRDLQALVRRSPRPHPDALIALGEARGLEAAIELRAGSNRRAEHALAHVPRRAWFAPALRWIAARPLSLPRVDCRRADAPRNHCGALFPQIDRGWLWRWALETTTAPANRHLATVGDLARLSAARPASRGPWAAGLGRRRVIMRQALLDRARAVPLALLDEPGLSSLEGSSERVGESARRLAGDAPIEWRTGWLSHRDTRSLSVTLFAPGCTTFVVEGNPWNVQPELRIEEPLDADPATGQRRGPFVWRSTRPHGDLRICTSETGNIRVDVTAGAGSGTFVLSWFASDPAR